MPLEERTERPTRGADVHRHSIASIAHDLAIEEATVAATYESELARFADARIKSFVPILVAERVRRRLRRRGTRSRRRDSGALETAR